MAEPNVQVPVSMIESLLDDFGNRRARAVREARALLSQQTPTAEVDRTPCPAETRSWDHFRPEQVDSYWITCDLLGPHDEHEDEHTGLTWRDPSTIRDIAPPSTESTK